MTALVPLVAADAGVLEAVCRLRALVCARADGPVVLCVGVLGAAVAAVERGAVSVA